MHFKLSAKSVLLWQIRLFPTVLLLIVAAAVSKKYNTAVFVSVSVLALLFTAAFAVYLPLYLKSFEIVCNENAISVKSGVIISVWHILPYPRTVYYRTYSTVFSRKFGLKGLVLKGARANILIPEAESNCIDALICKISENFYE